MHLVGNNTLEATAIIDGGKIILAIDYGCSEERSCS